MAKSKKAAKSPAKKNGRKAAKKQSSSSKRTKTSTSRKSTATGLMSDVERLMNMMASNDVTELDLEDGDRKISLKRGSFVAPPPAPAAPAPAPAAAPSPAAPADTASDTKPAENLTEITSPMVGTFYAAPSPDSDSYVKKGANVDDETVVCIVEAMKVMNEIKAECSGTIVEVCVKNAQPVEFGQVLFRVKPA